jgi:hypothetical protein|tara:strand:- start:13812 stop:14036 length:225 start_codon:yes stop_codon:yes gene_type:complete
MEWVGSLGLVGAALVTGLFTVIANRLRRENTSQHAANQIKLEAIGVDVREVKWDIRHVKDSHDHHLEWHLDKTV